MPESIADELVSALDEKYPFKKDLVDINVFFKTRILSSLLGSIEARDSDVAVLPTYSIAPIVLKTSEGGRIIVFDHILMILAQLYFRSFLICAKMNEAGESRKANVYIMKVYSVLVKVYADRDAIAERIHELNKIEADLEIDGSLEERYTLLHTSFCMTLEQFAVARELIGIRDGYYGKNAPVRRLLSGREFDEYLLSTEDVAKTDIDCLRWFLSAAKASGTAVGLNESLALSSVMRYFTIIALLEKNANFRTAGIDAPSALTRLQKLHGSLSSFRHSSAKKLVKQEIELASSLPDTDYLSFVDQAFGAILGGEKQP
jgi:hypothetical protein